MSQVQPARHEPIGQPAITAAVLSYIVPGLGQIAQGRVLKGIMFMVCLLGLFFGGQALGDWKNVYLPDVAKGPDDKFNNPWKLPRGFLWVANIIHHRWHFAGQFWIGAAAWPAIWQYQHKNDYLYELDETTVSRANLPPQLGDKLLAQLDPKRDKNDNEIGKLPRHFENKARFVSYLQDLKKAGKLTDEEVARHGEDLVKAAYRGTIFGTFQLAPNETEINEYLPRHDKTPDLAWVYTVIAGMLNILVIYDALAGPAYGAGLAHALTPTTVKKEGAVAG